MGRPRPAGDAERVGTDEIDRLARERLGFAELRPGQRPAVEALASGRDVLAVLPTGAGKSAIYELAGLLRAGPTVVVSPLIALEDDQLGHLRAAGPQATGPHSRPACVRRACRPLSSTRASRRARGRRRCLPPASPKRSCSCRLSSWPTPRPA